MSPTIYGWATQPLKIPCQKFSTSMTLYQDLPKGSGDKKLCRYYRLLTNHSRLGGVRNFRVCVKGCGKRRAERICHLLKTLINALADSVYISFGLKHPHWQPRSSFLSNDLVMVSNIIVDLNSSSTTTLAGIDPFGPGLSSDSSLPLLELAFQLMTTRYIIVGSLAVSCWYTTQTNILD